MSLQSDFQDVARRYAKEICQMYEFNESYGWWISDEIGGVYCNGDLFVVPFEELRLLVDNKVNIDEYYEYLEYCQWTHEFDQIAPNLKSWIKGCPRHSKETIQRLVNLKNDLEQECEIARNKFAPRPFN